MKCKNPATHVYVWNGKVIKQCDEHCWQAEGISRMMGWPFSASNISDGSTCSAETDEPMVKREN